jgi:hypothetical protein
VLSACNREKRANKEATPKDACVPFCAGMQEHGDQRRKPCANGIRGDVCGQFWKAEKYVSRRAPFKGMAMFENRPAVYGFKAAKSIPIELILAFFVEKIL